MGGKLAGTTLRCSLLDTEGWKDFDVHRRFVIAGDDDNFVGLRERGASCEGRPFAPSLCPRKCRPWALLFLRRLCFFELSALLIFMLVFHENPRQYWALAASPLNFCRLFSFLPCILP
jgi:hypothetical protein